MIRYTCESCGKSLKASEDIIGRKAQCTRCGTILRVPAASTRPSRNSAVDVKNPVDTLIAAPIGEMRSPPQSSNVSEPSSESPQSVPSADEFEPVFKRLEQKNSLVTPLILILAASLLALFAYGFWSFSLGWNDERTETAFEQTKEAIQYRSALFELKKSQRVLLVMADGYLAAKNLPETELGDLHEFVSALDRYTSESIAMEEANDLFDAGDPAAAKKLIEKETAILAEFQAEVQQRTKEFQAKTYQ